MKREVLCTFSNGGQLIRAKQSQIEFCKNLRGNDIAKAIDLNLLSYTIEEYYDVVKRVLLMKQYNTGKQAKMLNELRRVFTPLKPKRRRL
jgi:hypothetical protein